MKETDKEKVSLNDLGDEDLMKAYQLGDENAFRTLYERHSAKVFGFLKKRTKSQVITEDLFQGVFLKLHKVRSSYNPNFPFLPWLYTITKSVMLDGFRKAKKNQEIAYYDKLDQITKEDDKEPVTLPDLSQLSDRQKKALELRYEKELSFDEIAKELKTSPSNARQLVSRGIKYLRAQGVDS